ncbi:MAG: CusA/CzcA family heavy metal efflux RND transporter [Hydrogenophilales bacterium 12-61-10]|nr:MAG: CusA/CzcA family heavy metal efflux RND transporter [Hydrogenophilales bacterium 12-61-10]
MFNALVHASLKYRLFVLAVSLVLLVFGALNVRTLPVDVLPDLNKPSVTVMTEAPGMAPEQVEQLVTFPLESVMSGLPGVTRVRSVSALGLSILTVEFDWGTDIYRNRQQVAERLSTISGRLPPLVVPHVGPINSIMGEIMLVTLSGTGAAAAPMALRNLADWTVRPRLLSIPGVSQVIPIGGEVQRYQVSPNAVAMNQVRVTLAQIESSLRGYSDNGSGGFVVQQSQEYVVRYLGQSNRIEDLRNLVVTVHEGRPVLLGQVATVSLGAASKRGDASYMAQPAVILSVQKQPGVDTVKLNAAVEAALVDMAKSMPAGVKSNILFQQSRFIATSIGNLQQALLDAAVIVAIVLFLFLLNVRTTLISLIAIPVSILTTILVFRWLGLSINTMTLGGIAIAIGELVDDAVVDVENIYRRLRANAALLTPRNALAVVRDASIEVRSGVMNATLIIVLVFVPLFALPGIEGRLFASLGVAYIVAILASLLVAVTLTPVLSYYLLPGIARRGQAESWLLRKLKQQDTRLLAWSFAHQRTLMAAALLAVVVALAAVPFFPRIFLPAFNEGTLTVNVIMQPGTSLEASNKMGQLAEKLLLDVPEVVSVGRRTGRAELDEHAEGVHYSELDVDLKPSGRDRDAVLQAIRERLAALPAATSIGQPISHRLDHLLSGVRAQLSLKLYGDDLDALRAIANELRGRLARIPGLVDVQVEKQVRVPELKVVIDYDRARQYGVTPATVIQALEIMTNGRVVARVLEDSRQHDVVIRLDEAQRSPAALADFLVETPTGRVPLQLLARIEQTDGLNQINHENGRRRLAISANTDGGDMAGIIGQVRAELAATRLPGGVEAALEGQFKEREQAMQAITGLAAISLALIVLVLYSRYRSMTLVSIILLNIPLALVGSVLALALFALPLSVASLVGFITLAGISVRNGILKISHYINLVAHEGEPFGDAMIVRGSLERLAPVLMTALGAALALIPLMLGGQAPGKEILHPVAVVIFGGLISATLLDTLLTPVLFRRYGAGPTAKLLAHHAQGTRF